MQEAKCRDVTLCHDWTRVLVLAHKAVSKTEIVSSLLRVYRSGPIKLRPSPKKSKGTGVTKAQ